MRIKVIFLHIFLFFTCYIVNSQTVTFNFTGSVQTWTVPAGVTSVNFTVAGAKGGGVNGGNGAVITKNCFNVTPGQVLNIYVGGMGIQGANSGGWNGGGTGHTTATVAYRSWGGGGASDIRIGGTALANRVIVAGGGGGRGGGSSPVCGGAANCNNGGAGCSTFGIAGGGGTQTAGGAGGTPWAGTPPGGSPGTLGQGGQGGFWQTASGGGGGGGFYGGGGGGNDGCCTGANGGGGGGAGSSLVPAGGTCLAAGNATNGYVTITVSTLPGISATNTGPYCPGQTIQLNATGGGTYSWSGPNGFTSTLQNPTIPNMAAVNAGTYTVTVTNSGCSSSTTTTVTLNSGPTVNLTPSNAACASATNGSINVVATGSTPGYNVSWTGPSTGNPAGTEISASGGNYNIANLGVGTYTVTVTANNLCATTAITTINANPGVTGSATYVSPLCNSASNASITVTANLGIAPYQVSWTGPTTGNPAGDEITVANGTYQITSASAGSYTVTITDAAGCFYSFPVSVTQPASLTASSTMIPVLCNGGTTGSITGTATGGTAPYNMSWSGPINGDPAGNEISIDGGSYSVNNAPQGSYTITITDANGCLATSNIQVNQPLPLVASAVSSSALCNGSSDGSITVTASDGTAPYNVSWTGATTGDPAGTEISVSNGSYQITSVIAGNYTITVTDANGCTTQTTSTVTQPIVLSASATNTAALCNGSADGTITVTSNDGTPVYNVSWAGPVSGDPAGNEITTSGGNYTITGVSAGTYTITVTDANGCTTTTISTITEPTTVSATATNTSVLCNGGTTGSVTGLASGGTAPYDMSWAGPNTGDPAGDEINTDGGSYTVNGAPAGTYTITMTDGNGCVATTTTQIIEPAGLTASALNTAVLCNAGSSGTVQGSATGGTAPYNMSWTGPNTGNPAGDEINVDGGSYTVNGAPAGSYTITMTDGNGCTATATTTVIEPAILQVNSAPVPPLCNGVFNGSMNVTATGGTAPYDVSWSGPNSDNPIGTEIIANGGIYTITGVGAGTYTITLTDGNGCVTTTTTTLVPPVALTISTQPVDVACSGGNTGSIQVVANNGTPGYNVSWSGVATGSPNGIEINTSGGSYTIPSLIAGSYTVFVSDLNGCIDSNVVQIIEPTAISEQNLTTPALCSTSLDGTVGITVSGGIAPYNLELNGGTLSNPPGDEIISSGGSYTFTNLAIGNYTVIITDDNNCSITTSITISTNNNPPTVTMVNDTICTGQSATLIPVVNPSGGTFLWGNGSSGATLTISPITTTQYAVLYNYSGCLAQGSAFVVVNPIPTVTLSNETICAGESVTLSPTSAQPTGGSYSWSTNNTNSSITVNPTSTSNYSLIYTVNGCSSAPASATVTVNPVPSLTINSPAICIGETATLTATPNLPGGSVVWTPTNETTTSIDVTPVITSTYSAIYTLNGCSSNSVSTSVTVNAIPNVSFDVSILEGCSPLSVQLWNTSQDANLSTLTEWTIDNSSNFNGDTINPTLFAGCHDITLSMTVNGCVGTVTYDDFICAESIPVASFSPNINSFTESSQAIELINQSIGASSYSWNMGDGTFYTTTDVTHMYGQTSSGQTIWLTATSDLGCVDSTSITIPYEDAIIYYIPNTFTPDGNEFNNIFLPVFTAGIDFHTFEMSIFNRWGEVIFYSDDPTRGWEGTFGNQGLDVQSGVYTYLISFKTPQLDDRQIITGHVNLIR
jgi:gliding motility-associated-like protein